MNKEEKKAIEKIKKILYIFSESEELKLLLNLIEKQQKEIEDLEIKTKVVTAYHCDNLPTDVKMIILSKNDFERNISNDYISKDKIKGKMKEYQKHIDSINNKAPKRKDGKPNNIFNHANREFYKSKVEVLKELLEENNND